MVTTTGLQFRVYTNLASSELLFQGSVVEYGPITPAGFALLAVVACPVPLVDLQLPLTGTQRNLIVTLTDTLEEPLMKL